MAGDQDAIEYMCREAIPAIVELEHYGGAVLAHEDGRIYQRPFGGMTTRYGEGPPAQRTCAAADRTGHAILHTLYQQSLAHDAQSSSEYFALDLIMDADGTCRGVLALDMARARLHLFRAHGTVLATAATARVLLRDVGAFLHTAMAAAWCCAPASACRTWNSCSSTRPASTVPVAVHRGQCAAKVASCATATASASWSATRRA